MAGDQTLYSWMTVNGSGAESLFFELPCGWNRQLSYHYFSDQPESRKKFLQKHQCLIRKPLDWKLPD